MGKLSTARAVWAPHRASAGTSTSPMESCSVLVSLGWLMPPSCATGGRPSELAQPDPPHAVVATLGQHQGGAAARGQDVLAQVDLVDLGPDAARRVGGLLV